MNVCSPNGTVSCSGSAFPPLLGWTTWPDVNDDLSQATILFNVLFSLAPMVVVLYAPYYTARLVFDGRNAELYQRRELNKTLANSQLALKYFLFSILVPVVNLVQKPALLFLLPCSVLRRPAESCLSSSGMPDEWSVWAGGIFTLIFIDLMMRWSVPHLTWGTRPVYSKKQMRQLGYTEITAQWMVQALLALLLFLGPVPLSRYVVRDATYFQVLVGLFEGMVLALVLHVNRVKMLDGRAEVTFQHRFMGLMVRGGCLTKAARAEWQSQQHLALQDRLQSFPRLLWQLPDAARDEANRILSESLGEPLVEDEERGSMRSGSFRSPTPASQWRWSPSDIPGLEFMGLSISSLMNSLESDFEQKMQDAEKKNKRKMEQANVEFKQQMDKMEEEKKKRSEEQAQTLANIRQETEAKEREAEEQLQRMKEEAQETLANQKEEQQRLLEQRSAEHEEKLKKIAQERADKEREGEEQLQKMMQEAEEKLTKQREEQRQLQEKRSEEHSQKLQQMEQDAAAKEKQGKEQLQKMKEDAEEKLRQQKEEQQRRLDQESQQARERLQNQREENERKIKQADEEHRLMLEQKKREAEKIQEAFGAYQEQLKANSESLSILQKARDEGDIQQLGMGLCRKDILQFLEDDGPGTDDVKRLFKPVAKLAKDVYVDWTDARERFRVEKSKCASALTQDPSFKGRSIDSKMAGALFNSFVTCVEKGLVLKKDDNFRKACADVETMLLGWARETFSYCKDMVKDGADETSVHELIIHKAIWAQTQQELGSFDATDLNACLQTVDRKDMKFKELSLRQVKQVNTGDSKARPVAHLTRALQQLSNLIFFLNYVGTENLTRTYEQFNERLTAHKTISTEGEQFKSKIRGWIAQAQKNYHEPETLLRQDDLQDIENKAPNTVISSMEQRDLPGLDVFKDIFCMLARVWEQDFGVLVVPHHTQVVALLVFKAFLNNDDAALKTLIGQVSTGEGKSMLIASLALFVVGQGDASKRKRVHVIGSDEKLVQRDFESFKGVFYKWREDKLPDLPEKDFAVVCAKRGQDVRPSIPDESWIVYCEAKHISSYYTQKARAGILDVELYASRVLVIDEVDALIVDKDPTDEFVYDIGSRTVDLAHKKGVKISQYTKDLAHAFAAELGMVVSTASDPTLQELRPDESASQSIFREVSKLVKQVKQWKDCPDEKYKDENGNWYGTDKNGHVNKDYKSNFLEIMRLLDKKTDDVCWYERQYVMSKPRVFQLYSRIIGFSGTIGNVNEQQFLAQAYGANFFIVPPFLQTCKQVGGDGREKQLYFVAEWAPSGTWNATLGGPAAVLKDETEQLKMVSDLAFDARMKVPVLIITKDDEQVKRVTDQLERRALGLQLVKEDVVRPLNRTLFESSPRQYKENLRLSTRVYTSGTGKEKTWRITITDPSGARGTDYMMDDDDADDKGGLLLIMMEVPPSERDWIQYKGRTARQKWKGQYCVLLSKEDYQGEKEIDASVLEGLQRDPRSVERCDVLVDAILKRGVEKSKADLDRIQAAYNAGFVANEICERAWATFPPRDRGTVDIDLEEGAARSAFMRICRMYRYMRYQELLDEAKLISSSVFPEGFAPFVPNRSYQPDFLAVPPKMVFFMYDVSFSMKGPVGSTTRMGACKERLKDMLLNPQIIGDDDQVAVAAFGYGHKYLVEVGLGIRSKVEELMQGPFADNGQTVSCQNDRPTTLDPAHPQDPGNWGLGKSTYFFSTLEQMLKDLMGQGSGYQKNLWLIALTDGEPSDRAVKRTAALERLRSYTSGENNLIIITISPDVKEDGETASDFRQLVDLVQQQGGVGQYIAATNVEDTTAIDSAFRNVAASLVQVSGMTQED